MPRRRKLKLKLVVVKEVNDDHLSAQDEKKASSLSSEKNNHASHLLITPERKSGRSRCTHTPTRTQRHSLLLLQVVVDELNHLVRAGQLTYPGWQDDVDEFHQLHAKYSDNNDNNNKNTMSQEANETLANWVLSSRLQGIQHKQQASAGDRSHPHLKELDALLPHLTYPGWPRDYQVALQSHYRHDNDWNQQRALFRLQQKECVHNGDRGHPRLTELDAMAQKLTYPGHERHVQQCEELHFQYSDDYIGNNVLARQFLSLRHRQAHWEGGKHNHNKTAAYKALEQLKRHIPSYPGAAEDVHAAMEAHLYPCSIVESSGQVLDYATAMERVQHKQSALEQGDRTHPRLVALDRVVARAPPSLLQDSTLADMDQDNWRQFIQQLEEVHFRYGTEDWVGNAIFEKLLLALKRFQKQCNSHKATTTATSPQYHRRSPHKALTPSKRQPSTPSSTTTATTAASYSWSTKSDDGSYDDDGIVEIHRVW